MNPTDSSYDTIVKCVTNGSVWGDEKCSSIKRSFDDEEVSINNLKCRDERWHKSCYQLNTHKQVCEMLQNMHSESLQRREHEEEMKSRMKSQVLHNNERLYLHDAVT